MKLYLARHGQCEKNLIGIPGGSGAKLTQLGRDQAKDLAGKLDMQVRSIRRIVACPTIQTIETAQILADQNATPMCVRPELSSINLGVLSGIPISEARLRHPSSSQSMDRWRSGDLELCDLTIEGMENPVLFFIKGLNYLTNYILRNETEVVIATTSIMILLQNIHEMNGVERGEGYRARDYKNAELIELNFSSVQIEWLKAQIEKFSLTR